MALLDCTVKVFFLDSLKFFLSLYGHKLPVSAFYRIRYLATFRVAVFTNKMADRCTTPFATKCFEQILTAALSSPLRCPNQRSRSSNEGCADSQLRDITYSRRER